MPGPAASALRLIVRGAVQGTGFRPFVYRLARQLALTGSIRNTPFGVLIHVEGAAPALEAFRLRLPSEAPPAAMLRSVDASPDDLLGTSAFTIEASEISGPPSVAVLPDLATCPECVRELFDPADRRHGYPFLNCTACGPRLSIIEGLPYDRPRTAMKGFALCPSCAREYEDPGDRRFHAQPVACPACGPALSCAAGGDALEAALGAIRAGRIVAARGLGGYQLLVDACSGDAVARLRARKGREEKPFAVMFPDVASLRATAAVSEAEERWLSSAASPILLVPLLARGVLADQVAPGLRNVGAMLPYSPLHHLLLHRLGGPVVCTSGNLAEEPMALGPAEAEERLGTIADVFLHHDRPIVRAVDDSVARAVDGRLLLMRRARGFAPLPVPLGVSLPSVRALGGHLKNTVAWASGRQIVVSQHIGDMDHPLALEAQARTITDYERLFEFRPVAVACDLHPDYATTRLAEASGLPVVRVQHHHAHAAALLAEHDLDGEILAVSWDGTGFGPDGTVWGGEFLAATRTGYRRVARLLPFTLPGGEVAVRQPWRSAIGALYELLGSGVWGMALPPVQRAAKWRDVLSVLLASPHATRTSSAGRLVDAVAALAGLRQESTYEAHAAMLLEQVAAPTPDAYPFALIDSTATGIDAPALEVDWRPTLAAIVEDLTREHSAPLVSGRFHRTLARMTVSVAESAGIPRVGLTGGCFQNVVLTQCATEDLRQRGFDVLVHSQVPPNDGGLSAGQALVAASRLLDERT